MAAVHVIFFHFFCTFYATLLGVRVYIAHYCSLPVTASSLLTVTLGKRRTHRCRLQQQVKVRANMEVSVIVSSVLSSSATLELRNAASRFR
jgi:hypothetical protein